MLSPLSHDPLLTKEEVFYSVLLSDLETALQKIQGLTQENQGLTQENQGLKQENTELQSIVSQLKEQIALMQHKLFGKKTEGKGKLPDTGDSAVSGNGASGDPDADLNKAPDKKIVVSGYTRNQGAKKSGRNIDTSALPRHRIVHDFSEKEKICSCCKNPLRKIGEESSEKLELIPEQLYVAEHIWYKYSCSTCTTLRMPEKPQAPLPKAMAGGSLIADVVINKYQYHLPLYRQSKIMASYGAAIPDNTLGNWVLHSGDGLIPLYEALWAAIVKSRYLQADESVLLQAA